MRVVVRKSFLVALLCLSLLRIGLGGVRAVAQQGPTQAVAAATPTNASESAKRQETFDIVWTTIKEKYYDPTFGGVDWNKVREDYAPRVARVENNAQLYLLLQAMLNELHRSHFLIIPPEAIPKYPAANESEDFLEDDEEDAKEEDASVVLKQAQAKLAEQLTSGIGIDLRIQNGSAVITRVEPGSSAARAGLRPGYVLKSANGRSLDLIIDRTLKNPIWQSIMRSEMHQVLLAGYINGASQSMVRLRYLDSRNRTRRVSIMREPLKGELSPPIGNLPSIYTEFEATRLENGIGYIRFTAFVPSIMEKLCGAIRTMHEAPGLILDLRGNQGGVIGMISGLVGLLNPHQTYLGSMQMRVGRTELFSYPQESPYNGPLVILIDGTTQSAAEMFASALREQDLATIVGERSAGNTLPSVIIKLPTGALFQYGFANFRTRSGIEIEGNGVQPDINTTLSRRALFAGRDAQLFEAIDQVRFRIDARKSALQVGTQPGSKAEVVTGSASSQGIVFGDPKVGPKVSKSPPPPSPPPKKLSTATLPDPETSKKPAENLPSVDQILAKYLTARGGRAALEKLTSRITKGKAEISTMNLTGTAETFEKAPNKGITNIVVPGLGLIQQGFDGTKGWLLDSMRGYVKAAGFSLTYMRRQAIFDKDLRFKETTGELSVTGKEKVGLHEVFVLQETLENVAAERFYFDIDTGLLLRRNNTYFEDYREVDGVMLPFVIREQDSSGSSFVIRVTEIKHNVEIDDATFTVHPSCFTQSANMK